MTPRFAVGDRVVIKQGFAVGMTGVVHYVGETEGDLLYMVDYDELVEHEVTISLEVSTTKTGWRSMPTTDAIVRAEGAVLEYLVQCPEGCAPRALIDALEPKGFHEYKLRAAIWRLIDAGRIDLTWERLLRLAIAPFPIGGGSMNPDRTDYEGSIPLPVWEFFVKLYPTFDGDNHPKRVSSYATNASEIIVAYFHDALEDGLVTEQDLIDVGLTEVQIEAVKILTRDKANESYDTYIARIVDSGNALAQAVKTYDLFDHLHPRLRATLPPSKAKRYLKALTALVLASS